MADKQYKAFISYAHADGKWAQWLHKSLESYVPPRSLRVAKGLKGRRALGPIFRDQQDFAASHNLTGRIETALENSEYLILLCSPSAANSRWVNDEIRLFRKFHDETKILCAIVDGTPETAFPPALFETNKTEPLAANPQTHADGKKLGQLKIAAGLLGVGLDDLLRRDLQRKYQRVTSVTAASVLGMVVMGIMTNTAVQARKEATQRKADAEGLIEFMLTDLKTQLEPVGRLDVLDAVGARAVEYYEQQDISDMSDDSLERRARAFQVLGEVDQGQGNIEQAIAQYERAAKTTQALLEQDPSNPERIFNHSQNVFWVGYGYIEMGDIKTAKSYMEKYQYFSEKLFNIAPNNADYIREVGYAENNMAYIYEADGDVDAAYQANLKAIKIDRQLLALDPEDISKQDDLSTSYGWLSLHSERYRTLEEAKNYNDEQLSLLTRQLSENPENVFVKLELAITRSRHSQILFASGDLDTSIDLAKRNLDPLRELARYDESSIANQIHYFRQLVRLVQYEYSRDLETAREYFQKIEAYANAPTPIDKSNLDWALSIDLPFKRTRIKFLLHDERFEDALDHVKDFQTDLQPLEAKGLSGEMQRSLNYNVAIAKLYTYKAYKGLGQVQAAERIFSDESLQAEINAIDNPGAEYQILKAKILQISGQAEAADLLLETLKARGFSTDGRLDNQY